MEINRLEFIITYNCSGRCKHCSVGDMLCSVGQNCVDQDKASEAVRCFAATQSLESVMTFGGEPLIYIDTVCAIHEMARDYGVPKRQIITNGYFSKDKAVIAGAAQKLKLSGVNDIIISVDAFHQETIPLDIVHFFAESLLAAGAEGVRIQPSWVVNREHDNEYNARTRQVLKAFEDLEIPVRRGDDIFLAGNAKKYLSEFYGKQQVQFDSRCGQMPYTAPPDKITGLSIVPNGDVMPCSFVIGNVYKQSIEEIIRGYDPYKIPLTKILLEGGMPELLTYANDLGIDSAECYNICDVCKLVASAGL